EALLKKYVKANPASPEAGLVWVRWLSSRGKREEALKELSALEKRFKDNRTLKIYRAQLLWDSGQSEETLTLLKSLSGDRPNLMVNFLEAVTGDAQGGSKLKEALSKNEHSGLVQYYNGMLAQYQRRWRQAVKHYERCLQVASLTPRSEGGLLVCLLNLSAQESPAEANKLAFELLQAHPQNPALLLAFALTAVP